MTAPKTAFTVWFTGVPAAGKTTLARLLRRHLRRTGSAAEVIDGDALRAGWCAGLGFSRKDRETNIRRAGTLARLLNEAGIIACVALVSPIRRSRDWCRRRIAVFVEVHVHCPLSVCRARDPKGLYARAARGKLTRLTGVADPYEAPRRPDLRLQTSMSTPYECLRKIRKVLKKRKLL